ncbi:RDS/peripherin-like protein xRDS35 [Anthophora quadrimaculata]
MSSNESSRKSNAVYKKNARVPCNCGWEVRFGYGVAVTLAIFEAKRFFMLILEIFAEWQIIRFAGGLRPVIFTLINVSLGLPTALITVRSIRARKVPRCCAETRRTLKCLLIVIAICAITNAATLVSIGYHISVRQETLIDIFNSSMHLYVTASSYKYAIDEIQFIFQCCGHSSYADWFLFDWQGVDYASREEMAVQSPISDEEYRDRSVPFSCCNLRAMSPCEHTEILEADMKTINTNGCAEIVSPVLLRIVIVAYVMTSTLVIIQVFLAFLITKIIRKLLCGTCRFYHMQRTFINESTSASLEATSSDTERRASSSSRSNWETRSTRTTKRRDKRKRYDKRVSSTTTKYVRSKNKGNAKDGYSSSSPFDSSPSCRTRGICGAARIRPSVHEEHTISKKPLCQA